MDWDRRIEADVSPNGWHERSHAPNRSCEATGRCIDVEEVEGTSACQTLQRIVVGNKCVDLAAGSDGLPGEFVQLFCVVSKREDRAANRIMMARDSRRIARVPNR